MDKTLSISGHLQELRRRLIFCLVVLVLSLAISFPFAQRIIHFLKYPAADRINKLAFFGPEEAFLVYMKAAFIMAFILALPFISYQLWAFLTPAINLKHRRYSIQFVASVVIVFITGCLFAYFIMLGPALNFLLSFGKDELIAVISASRYISFVSSLILLTGLVFEMPVLSYIFTRLGLIKASWLRGRMKYAILAIFILSAVITPTADMFNMLLLALPMVLLYELSIWVSYFTRPLRTARKNPG
ncbi:MAG: twin-arginine translocase subunit TatC [Candidatus Omnitrophica bacterium]|nr:twin-arginine translocase subunit TatC [Candidatus Omnitrophota bacterium]